MLTRPTYPKSSVVGDEPFLIEIGRVAVLAAQLEASMCGYAALLLDAKNSKLSEAILAGEQFSKIADVFKLLAKERASQYSCWDAAMEDDVNKAIGKMKDAYNARSALLHSHWNPIIVFGADLKVVKLGPGWKQLRAQRQRGWSSEVKQLADVQSLADTLSRATKELDDLTDRLINRCPEMFGIG